VTGARQPDAGNLIASPNPSSPRTPHPRTSDA
jgi:hypothetical protein